MVTSVLSPEDEEVPRDDTRGDKNQTTLGREEEYSSPDLHMG